MQQETATARGCERAIQNLLGYCRKERWSGYDPYDGLNSALFRLFPSRRKLIRTAMIQLVKRSPLNLRPLLGIKKGYNPKGLALAARALVLLSKHYGRGLPPTPGPPYPAAAEAPGAEAGLESDFAFVMDRLASLRSSDHRHACWGYNFDWQSRAFFAPRGTPNVVCTAFAGHAFLDWYEEAGAESALRMAESSCRFLLDDLNRTPGREGCCFSYTPLDSSRVHNVNLLAAELLARVHTKNGSEEFRDAAETAVKYTLSKQNGDGSWAYGEARSQRWVDNFHTGFMIVSLKHIIDHLGATSFRESLTRGYRFYEERFFLADSTPKYYHDKLYPIDAHSAAQAVITFLEMVDLMPTAREMSARTAEWAIRNMQDPAGFFYFQKHRLYTIKTPFMRWSQTWMLYALSLYLQKSTVGGDV